MDNRESIEKLLRDMGGEGGYCGFRYAAVGVSLILSDSDYLIGITKGLYRELADQFETTVACVERDIRTLAEAIWKTGNPELLEKVARRKLHKRPSNKKFLDMLSSYISEQNR